MKNNQPISQNEVQMREGSVIVSRTDLKGLITYINQDFLDISGFSEVELIGKSHNMVRHPDMPSAAFKDLWATIKEGKPWVGMVKNRCKNGDHYWVEAHVTPVLKNGEVSEFLSVRKIPSREKINRAEALYEKLNAGTASLPESNSLVSLFSIRNRIIAAYSLMALFMFGLGLNIFGSATIGFMIFGVIISIILAFLTIKQVINPLSSITKTINSIQENPIDSAVDFSMGGELGAIQRAIKSLQIKVGYDITAAREEAEKAQRIQQALDNVTSNVMLADTSYNIVYMNKAVEKMFVEIESDIKKELPDFDARHLSGVNIDIFHKDPSHQRAMLDALSSTHRSTIHVANRTLTITANPVVNNEGIRRGTVVEWQDRTDEVAVELEVENLVQSSKQGDLSKRINVQDKTGFFKQLGLGINDLLDVVSDSFSSISTVMQALSEGDLTKDMQGNYSGEFATIQDTINSTLTTLKNLVGNIRDASGQISSAANEISQGNTDLSQRTEEQASSLEETASSMEELTSTVRQNADNSRQANQLAANASSQAKDGGAVIESTITAMDDISQSSRRIEDIIGVINEIAFQTNLLALNAAVEAARAGEQGRGFAVVASEVRNLAQRSAAAATEIRSLIKDSVEKVDEGTRLASDSGKTLSDIVNSVKKVSDIIAEIAASSSEQSQGIGQINQAITQLDEVTQQNAALVEQAAAASESMDEQATNMNKMVGFFSTGESAKNDSAINRTAQKISPPVAAIVVPAKTQAAATVIAKPEPDIKTTVNDSDWEEF